MGQSDKDGSVQKRSHQISVNIQQKSTRSCKNAHGLRLQKTHRTNSNGTCSISQERSQCCRIRNENKRWTNRRSSHPGRKRAQPFYKSPRVEKLGASNCRGSCKSVEMAN